MRDRCVEEGVEHELTPVVLGVESSSFCGTGGVSAGNYGEGFRPAFLDTNTDTVHLSRFLDGRPAPFHLLDGLPDDLVLRRSAAGGAEAVKATVVTGFVRFGRFYTRQEAALAVARDRSIRAA